MNNPQESENLVDELHNQPYEPMVAAEIWLVSISLFTGIIVTRTLMRLFLKSYTMTDPHALKNTSHSL